MLHAYHEEQTPVRLIDVKPCILTGQEATLLAGRSPSASPQIQSLSEYQGQEVRHVLLAPYSSSVTCSLNSVRFK